MTMRFHRGLFFCWALGGVLATLPAGAEPASDYPAPCDPSKVTRADSDRAHTVFLSGKQYLEESNYDKAIGYFKDAYSIDCSVHGMLPIIATAYERKGDRGEAVHALEEYLRRAPSSPDHDVIERRIKNLKDQLGREQAAAAASAPPVAAPPPSPPPVASSEPAPPAPSATPASSAMPPPAPPPREGHSALPWVAVGVGGAAFITGIVLYGVGAGGVSSALNVCKDRSSCPTPSAVEQGNNGRTLEEVGGPVLGIGLGLAVVGLVWHFLEKPADDPGAAPAAAPSAAVSLQPVVAPGYGGATFRAAF